MHTFLVSQLHLAAYIKANGGQLAGIVDSDFSFVSDRPLAEWRIEHSNSCCRRVDIEMIGLRELRKTASPAKS
jgi:hypothetical protein